MFRKKNSKQREKITYSLSGVNISKVEKALQEVRKDIESTHQSYVLPYWNGFSSVLEFDLKQFKNPLFLLSTDGVGTKLSLAIKYRKLSGIGFDLVAMNVNDIITSGGKPLAFLDYFGGSKIDPEVYKEILKSISLACKEANCSLVGGETAEMPGIYKGKEIDLVGFVFGVVEKDNLLPKKDKMRDGNILIGVTSSGFHSNGYSLIRYILKKKRISLKKDIDGHNLLEELLKPTKIYSTKILPLLERYRENILGIAHITGGGIVGNLPRILPDNLTAIIESSWDIPWIFKFFIRKGNISIKEAFRVFNMGIGLILVVSDNEERILKDLDSMGEKSYIIGSLKSGKGGVKIEWKRKDLEF